MLIARAKLACVLGCLASFFAFAHRARAYQEEDPTTWSAFRFSLLAADLNSRWSYTGLPEWTPWEPLYGPLSIRASLGFTILAVYDASQNRRTISPFIQGRGILGYDFEKGMALELGVGMVLTEGKDPDNEGGLKFGPMPLGTLDFVYRLRPKGFDSLRAGLSEIFNNGGGFATAVSLGTGFTF
jgi:hypothetical protein